MTRRDYELIAKAFRDGLDGESSKYLASDFVLSALIETLADALADDNPAFDRDRFIYGCIPQAPEPLKL